MVYVVPIVCQNIASKNNVFLVKCSLLLDRNGTSCINTNAPEEFAETNDLVLLSQNTVDEIVFLEVDASKTDLQNFYTWSEVLPNTVPMKEVWRTFIWNTADVDNWGTNMNLNTIDCSPFSIGHVLNAYFKTKR